MPTVKYSRIDGRKPSTSSSYLSTMTLVVVVALCLVGVWMMTSSSSEIPIQNLDMSSGANKDDVSAKAHLSDSNENTNAGTNKDDVSAKAHLSNSNENTNAGANKDDVIAKPLPNTTTSSESNNVTNESSPNDKEVKMKQFEDNTGNLPKDAINGDANRQEQNSTPVEKERSAEKNQEDKSVEEKKKEGEQKSEVNENRKSDTNGNKKKSEESSGQTKVEEKGNGQIEQKVEEKNDKELNQGSAEKKDKGDTKDQSSKEVYPSGAHSGLLNETVTQNGSFSTQAAESKNEKEAQKSSGQEAQKSPGQEAQEAQKASGQEAEKVYNWKLCKTTAGPDYIPCLDNWEAIRKLHTTMHYEHRERHCPSNPPTCLVPLPEGYQRPIQWPTSRDKIWYHNVPHTQLAEYKKDQNWVKVSGEYLTFPGGGTQFKHGALHYIDTIQQSVPDIAWGKHSRVILDVGCGVASFGGYLFERDVLTMSLAPKDEHEAQVQFALERGIPAVHAVMGTKRLPFPGRVFDAVHCARCRVPWHIDGGKLLLELNRLLRPGGFFVWSATPVYQKDREDVEIWEAMKKLTKSICWEQVSITRDKKNGVGIAFYRKPATNECYEHRQQNEPPLCPESDDPNAAWNVSLQACIHKLSVAASERGSKWPEQWPARLDKPPYWLSNSQVGGVYGKPAPEDFASDYEHWKNVVHQSYLNGIGINWSTVRNVMDMRAIYGGFAAALKDMKVWVMNVVSVDDPDTLPIIYERGLIGTYHDWCESFSTYPRSYDLLHANYLFSMVKKKCNYMAFIAEVDRMLRPEGKLIVRDTVEIITELENMFKSMHWEIRMTYSADKEGLICAQKTMWRPKELEVITYAVTKGAKA